MTPRDRQLLLLAGLKQLDDTGLRRVIRHKGKMLLTGCIFSHGSRLG